MLLKVPTLASFSFHCTHSPWEIMPTSILVITFPYSKSFEMHILDLPQNVNAPWYSSSSYDPFLLRLDWWTGLTDLLLRNGRLQISGLRLGYGLRGLQLPSWNGSLLPSLGRFNRDKPVAIRIGLCEEGRGLKTQVNELERRYSARQTLRWDQAWPTKLDCNLKDSELEAPGQCLTQIPDLQQLGDKKCLRLVSVKVPSLACFSFHCPLSPWGICLCLYW